MKFFIALSWSAITKKLKIKLRKNPTHSVGLSKKIAREKTIFSYLNISFIRIF
jgi:hypothetical protein